MKYDKQATTNADDALTPSQREAKIERIKQFALNKAKRLGHDMELFEPTETMDQVTRPDEFNRQQAADAIASCCKNHCPCMIVIYTSGKIELDYTVSWAITEQCEPDPDMVEYFNKHKLKIA